MDKENITLEEKKAEIIKDRQSKIRESGYHGEVNYSISFIGKGKETGKDFFIVEEFYLGIEKESFYEYGEEPKELSVVRNEFTDGKILPLNDVPKNEEELKELMGSIQDLERCIQDRERELNFIVKEYKIDKEDIDNISEINFKKILENKENEKQQENEDERDKNEHKKISEKEAKQIGIDRLNSVKTESQVDTKGSTLGKELGIEQYESLLVVHSNKLAQLKDEQGEKGRVNPTPFSLVGRKPDGTLEVIKKTKLKYYDGANNDLFKINDKNNIETEREICMFEVPNSKKRIAIDMRAGIPEVYYGISDKKNEGNVMERIHGERDGKQWQDVEVRQLFNKNHGEYHTDRMVDEMKDKGEENCDKAKDKDAYKNVDGDNKTAAHLHKESKINYDGIQDATFEKLAKIEGGCITSEEIEELLNMTNQNLDKITDDPEKAIKLAIEKRNKTLIQYSKNPEMIEELMKTARINNPRIVIEVLEKTGWQGVEEAKEQLGKTRGENND